MAEEGLDFTLWAAEMHMEFHGWLLWGLSKSLLRRLPIIKADWYRLQKPASCMACTCDVATCAEFPWVGKFC
jgi:hypothetical protein